MMDFVRLLILVPISFYEKSLKAISKHGRIEAVELENKIAIELC
ncbi:hypothetical protein SORDD16_01286 [Streptococcus oralis]|uniref:Uncharacterized protein n=1 Tax=Streptococcus oralis TaxID=1303 RepID=A0A139PBP7_STROR|nr:hypothetical protein SORDD16_01286 [Streptococcus oralis]